MWRVYYGDGTTYGHDSGPPELAPKTGVQIIARTVESPNGPQVGYCYGRDHYWWLDGDGWVEGDWVGREDYLMGPGLKVVLFGRTIHTPTFRQIVDLAMRECDPWVA